MSTEIHGLGYRPYEGERAGSWWAMRSLATHSVRRALGLKRSARHKIAPFLTIAFAFIPAIGLAAASVFLGAELADDLISFGQYNGIVAFALLLFTAAVVPGVLTTDRTNGMLALYLASPLTRTTYIAARALGIFVVMLIVTTGPIVFLILAFSLVSDGFGPGETLSHLARGLLAGGLLAAFWTTFGMLISSFPRRWGIASTAIVGTLFVADMVGGALTEGADAPDALAFLSPGAVIGEAWERIFDDPVNGLAAMDARSTTLVLLVAVGMVVLLGAGTWWRYQTIEVER